jgi:hypothetical protein
VTNSHLPIVTFSGRVHYRDAEALALYDPWDRDRARPQYAAMCNPNTIGWDPMENSNGVLVAREGVEAATKISRLTVCKRCAKKIEAAK